MGTTRYLQVDAENPDLHIIKRAAEFIKAGELVAFPTETVYGLGADAFQSKAVGKIFQAKGRPAENALLVHISNQDQVLELAEQVPVTAQKLIDRFWPGPLSIILPSKTSVPEIVRGGQNGVGLRMPSHPVALALIEETGPLAAPSANLYGRPSPTNAEHVKQDLDSKIAAVLDAGDTGAGLESTVVDLTTEKCIVLRRGGINVELIEEFLGFKIEVSEKKSLPRYKTNVRVILSDNEADFEFKLKEYISQGLTLGLIHIDNTQMHKIDGVKQVYNLNVSERGTTLYSILRDAEEKGINTLLVAPIDLKQAGAAIMDRLSRAASRELP
jgi:L-threonylcarbamoyladenylate synthase